MLAAVRFGGLDIEFMGEWGKAGKRQGWERSRRGQHGVSRRARNGGWVLRRRGREHHNAGNCSPTPTIMQFNVVRHTSLSNSMLIHSSFDSVVGLNISPFYE